MDGQEAQQPDNGDDEEDAVTERAEVQEQQIGDNEQM